MLCASVLFAVRVAGLMLRQASSGTSCTDKADSQSEPYLERPSAQSFQGCMVGGT